MKGIILAGGHGTRLRPMTIAVSKHLLPVYNKPMIYYPLATLMLAGIRDILIITKPDEQAAFKKLLGTGSDLGIKLTYEIQDNPKGIAQAITIGADFIGNSSFTLILGDNIFFGAGLGEQIRNGQINTDGGTIFAYRVSNPEAYGVVTFDENETPLALEEKPKEFLSNWAVTGLYVYTPDAVDLVRTMKPSVRGELEITDLNKLYLKQNRLKLSLLSRGYCWMDMGTPENLLAASDYVRTIENRQGLEVCNPQEVSKMYGWI